MRPLYTCMSTRKTGTGRTRLPTVKPNTHRRRRRDATVELRRVGVGGVNTIRNYRPNSRRLPMDSVDSLETEHSSLTNVDL